MTASAYLIHPKTRLGYVHYTVQDLDRQIEFYRVTLGFQEHWRDGRTAGLGAGGEDLLRMTEVPGAQRWPRTTGMYHYALLYPTRRELARAVARLFELGVRNYPTDHVFSKTTYLDDPEGNNIELYVYSLEDGEFTIRDGQFHVRWADGRPSDGREPLDLEALFSHLEPGDRLDAPLPSGTVMGHVHMYASDLERSMRFYRDVLGFKEGGLAFRMGFADVQLDRPHVIAWNTWMGQGAPSPPVDSLGVRFFTIVLPDRGELNRVMERVRRAGIETIQNEAGYSIPDPSQVRVLLTDEDKVSERRVEPGFD